MPESLEASSDIDQIRRELIRLNERVAAVDERVERVRVTQMAALATTMTVGDDIPRELVLKEVGMTNAEIAKALTTTEDAVRMRINRARSRG